MILHETGEFFKSAFHRRPIVSCFPAWKHHDVAGMRQLQLGAPERLAYEAADPVPAHRVPRFSVHRHSEPAVWSFTLVVTKHQTREGECPALIEYARELLCCMQPLRGTQRKGMCVGGKRTASFFLHQIVHKLL